MVAARWIGLAMGLGLFAHVSSAQAENTYDRRGRIARDPNDRPAVLKPVPGQTPPDGYRAEERPRVGLLIAGPITTVGGILLVAHAATSEDKVFYISGIACLAAGLPMLAVGLFDQKTVWVRGSARLELTPVVGLGHAGGSATLRF